MNGSDLQPKLVKIKSRAAWHIRDGKLRISTRTSDRREAESALQSYIAKRRGAAAQAKRADLATLADALAVWSDERKSESARTWEKKWQYVIRTLERHAGLVDLADIDRKWSRDYRAARAAEGVSDAAVISELSVARAAIRFVIAERMTDIREPSLIIPRQPPPRDVFLTRDQFARLERAAESVPHLSLFIDIAISTGARPGFILALKWHNVHLDRGLIDTRQNERSGRRKRGALVPIPPELVERLRVQRAEAQCEHVIEFSGASVKSVRKSFATAVEAAGMDPRKITPHVLRHTAATWMAQSGLDLWSIAGFLGHSDIAMITKVYGHHCPEHMQKGAQAIARARSALS